MKNKVKQKILTLIALIVTLVFSQGCNLATVGKALDETDDKLIGVWVVLPKDDMELASELNLEGFKSEDAHVIYLDAYVKDDEQYLELKTTGNIYDGATSVHIRDQSRGIEVTAKVYFSSSSPNSAVLLPIYERTNGDRYALGDNVWQGVGEADYSLPRKFFISRTTNEIEEGMKVEVEVMFLIDMIHTRNLASSKILYLDENYTILQEEVLNLKDHMNNTEPSQLKVLEGANMVVIEESFMSPLEEKPYIRRTLYQPSQEERIIHDFILPEENDLARHTEMEILFSK